MIVENNLSPLGNITFQPGFSKDTQESVAKSSFDSFFNAAMDVINETNKYQLVADQAQLDLVTGKTDNILSVLLAQEKAYSSLNFTVQVTNKIIEGYREIMRMQM